MQKELLAGWQHESGKLQNNSKTNLFVVISRTLFIGKHTTTYKYCFLKSILDNLYNVDDNLCLSFNKISETFSSVYWNMIAVHNMPQMPNYNTGARSEIEKIVEKMIQNKPYLKRNSDNPNYFWKLNDEDKEMFIKETMPKFSKYVVGAFYKDTDGKIYGFSKKEKKIWFNDKSISFLRNNKTIIEQVNYYQWLKMIEYILKSNETKIDNLSMKLETITKRINLTSFKEELMKVGELKECFYCGKALSQKYHLDHVIPWNYMKSDNLWNFVFACPKCNSSKNNKIPDQVFLDRLNLRNANLKIHSPNIKEVAASAERNGIICGWKPGGNTNES